ncbi:hypothetical protein B0H16DRAFT_1900455 [Mycena metata]|uniref:Uncharacterized protein n=1 Tax=Mycena metata TaxID=1033252 RepID=A0AAD7H4S2_9AGAR|nr:hypothetical protein B0H16DRAFT_1900455 [Mycena metata]
MHRKRTMMRPYNSSSSFTAANPSFSDSDITLRPTHFHGTRPWRIPILPDDKRRNKSTGCGVKVHASATPTGRRMGASDDAEAVVKPRPWRLPYDLRETPTGLCARYDLQVPPLRRPRRPRRPRPHLKLLPADPPRNASAATTRVNPVGRISHPRSCALIFHDIPLTARGDSQAPANEEEEDMRREDIVTGAAALAMGSIFASFPSNVRGSLFAP